jgi:hypothetical protein
VRPGYAAAPTQRSTSLLDGDAGVARHVIVSEIAALTGWRPLAELRDADFRRSPAALAW